MTEAHPSALFTRDGDDIVPTEIARGPWRADALHGGAVAALLAHAVDVPGRTPTRITFDLMAAVPYSPLTLRISTVDGGSRVVRQSVELRADDLLVARAQCLAVRQADAEVPPATEWNPFHGHDVPPMDRPRPSVAEAVGWECFDSGALAVRGLKSADAPADAVAMYITLLADVVAGETTAPISRVAAASDYASNALSARLPFDRWSFMNAELTVHVSRPPAGRWVGLVTSGVVGSVGAGFSSASLFDENGRVGQAAQALVVEKRDRTPSSARSAS